MMLDNNVYNLMLQITQEHKSLWRIKNHYLKDAGGEGECSAYWQKLAQEKEQHIQELLTLLKKYLK